MCQDLQAMGTHKANGCETPKTQILKGLNELTGSEKSKNPNIQLHESSSKFVKLLTDRSRSSSTNCRLLQIVETGFNTNVVEGNIESADPPLGAGFTGLRGRGGGPLDPAAGTTGVELLMRPASRDDPLRPVWDPSSAAGRVMIGGDIPVLLSLETTTAAAAAALDSSLSAHAPRWLMRRDGGRGVSTCSRLPELLLLPLCKSRGTSDCCCFMAFLLEACASGTLQEEGCCCCCWSHGRPTDDSRGGFCIEGCIDKRRSSMDGNTSGMYLFWAATLIFSWLMRGICKNGGKGFAQWVGSSSQAPNCNNSMYLS